MLQNEVALLSFKILTTNWTSLQMLVLLPRLLRRSQLCERGFADARGAIQTAAALSAAKNFILT